ncbi:DUF3307 domain-containing protein [Neptunomonas qingdaonensis]|uniref:DUF3307 domain-containing protein n=1 Tax=Neptunomonas qingdaonensis TaxID=1045558 RepID=A0A1I2UKN2_9GAMM|nr:DUF3307 domain-containing protein [Neptunomonas qingdaonensis]SFG77610.1 Protein of unknown function [Neptunomonas qingdaonensis]
MNDISLLLLLIIAHVIGDFYLQPNPWVICRYRKHFKSPSLYKHAGVHGILTFLILILFSPISLLTCVALAAFILICHLSIDLLKSYLQPNLRWFLLDQALHILCLIAVWGWLDGWNLGTVTSGLINIINEKSLIIAMAYIICAKPASIIISLILKKWTPHLDRANAGTDITTDASSVFTEGASVGSLKSAGETIGYLERWLVLSFVLLDLLSGIGFLLAAKSVFRFNDLSKSKDMKLTEYIMLGTFSSVTIALGVGLFATYIIK